MDIAIVLAGNSNWPLLQDQHTMAAAEVVGQVITSKQDKKRRKTLRVTGDLLFSPQGFLKLKRETAQFPLAGKGHEVLRVPQRGLTLSGRRLAENYTQMPEMGL